MRAPLHYFHPVLAASRLGRKPVQVKIAGERFALFRDAEGRPAALADACPHRFAPLSMGNVRPDGRLQCSYHGWHFGADGDGHNPSQPNLRCAAKAFRVIEREGTLWLSSQNTPNSDFPELGWPGYQLAGRFAMRFDAPLHVCLDNFSEDEHFPWVHTRLGWDDGGLDQIQFEAHSRSDHSEVIYQGVQRPSRVLPLIGIREGDRVRNHWTTRFDPIRALFTLTWADPGTGAARPLSTRVMVFLVPETEQTTLFHVFQYVRISERSKLRWFGPVLRIAALALGWLEIRDDARFISRMADTPRDLKGMRLDRFDKPVIHNRKLLKRIYWGDTQEGGQASISLVP